MKVSYDRRTDTLTMVLGEGAAVAESDEDNPGVIPVIESPSPPSPHPEAPHGGSLEILVGLTVKVSGQAGPVVPDRDPPDLADLGLGDRIRADVDTAG